MLALIVCVIGLLMYALASDGKVIHIGDVMFWTGLLAFLIGGGSWWPTFIKKEIPR
jgi:hypothetical protein